MDDYRDLDKALADAQAAALRQYDAAARKFIRKVDSGKAKSVETYKDLKAALDTSTRAQNLFS